MQEHPVTPATLNLRLAYHVCPVQVEMPVLFLNRQAKFIIRMGHQQNVSKSTGVYGVNPIQLPPIMHSMSLQGLSIYFRMDQGKKVLRDIQYGKI